MSDDGTVNSQTMDAVASVVTLATGQSPSQAAGMMDAVLLETLGMAMYNAVNRQQSASMVGSAAVTAACARMLGAQPPAPPPPPAPDPGTPPSVNPLPGPTPTPSPGATVASAYADGQAAIDALKLAQQTSSTVATQAQTDLSDLAQQATAAAQPAGADANSDDADGAHNADTTNPGT